MPKRFLCFLILKQRLDSVVYHFVKVEREVPNYVIVHQLVLVGVVFAFRVLFIRCLLVHIRLVVMVIYNLGGQLSLIITWRALFNIFLVIAIVILNHLLLFNCFEPFNENPECLGSELQIGECLYSQGIQIQQHLQTDLTWFIAFFNQIYEVFLHCLFGIGVESTSGFHD